MALIRPVPYMAIIIMANRFCPINDRICIGGIDLHKDTMFVVALNPRTGAFANCSSSRWKNYAHFLMQ